MQPAHDRVSGALITDEAGGWYRIDGVDHLEAFLTTVVSDSDLWLFASSAGPLTAGRTDADHALLPYETDDRLHRAVGVTGPLTLLAREVDGRREVWQPFARRTTDGCQRAIAKHVLGTALLLEETNPTFGLRVRTTWEPSPTYGWVRTVELTDLSGTGTEVEVLDGLLDVMPHGVDARTEQTTSNLVDSYKRSETGAWGTAAVYALESLITDRAEPAESLAATLVFAAGLDHAEVHLDERVVDAVFSGQGRQPVPLLTGRRGAYLLRGEVTVPAHGATSWMLVADVGLGHARLHDRVREAADPEIRTQVRADIVAGRERLGALLTAADGRQDTADPVADAHHLSNVLFNVLRGGTFPDGYVLPVADLIDFFASRNLDVHRRHAASIQAFGPSVHLDEVLTHAEASGDADLVRLVLEYLPLAYSRRHGDPSRPWNRFSIRTTTEHGALRRYYEGNWRDIFQNWEALLRSFPRYLPSVVATFVDASTVDGHNPYRISRDGVDWELLDPDDPWSNIGYWGDHQIVYLHRLLVGWEATAPDGLQRWLDRAVFTYADVPYRIAGHAEMLADPRATITFDEACAKRVEQRVQRLGADGRLVEADGQLVRVTLAEKLLLPALAKLCSYVAGGGIWMNTQRPEWNDGNNALAGYGLSMVTLYQLEAYLAFLQRHLVTERETAVTLSRPVAGWAAAIEAALGAHDPKVAAGDERARRALLDALGVAGETYRTGVQAGFDPTPVEVAVDRVDALLRVALAHLRATILTGERDDGLFHAYNLVAFPDPERAQVHHLPAMLEGQVAVLGTTCLDAERAATLVESLYDSPLYRPDQHSFLLYPPAPRPSFLDRNRLPDDALERHPALRRLLGGEGGHLLELDAEGGLHFRAGLSNAVVLAEALTATELDAEQRSTVLEVYEQLFRHRAFTGRSGGMHGYEGIGSVYWHMVAKLLLAVQERIIEVEQHGGGEAVRARLVGSYRRIRDGLGFRRSPASYGAFPTDCYSHTPAHSGAQQPGMTGQVKEEVLTRFGELGLRIAGGEVSVGRALLPADELWHDLDGLPGYALSLCGVPFEVRPGDHDQVHIVQPDGNATVRPGTALTRAESDALFDRASSIARIVVTTSQGPA